MAIETRDGKYKCMFCGKKYSTWQKAEECIVSHNLIYIPATAEELNSLMQYIYEQDRNIPITLIERIKKIIKDKAGKTH